jgi:two-component system response regulator ChvI
MAGEPMLVVVEDDDVFAKVLINNLAGAGFAATHFDGPETAMVGVPALERCDLLVLDWRLPGMTGVDLLEMLRKQGCKAPALLLTSHDDVFYEEAALEAGAIDFISKTRSFSVLRKRVELVLAGQRRDGGVPAATLKRGPLLIEPSIHQAKWDDKTVSLTLGEFRVTERWARAQGDVSYRQLYDVLKGESFIAGSGSEGYRANVRTLVKRIRQKFCDVDEQFAAIVSVPGFGYRWREGAPDGQA